MGIKLESMSMGVIIEQDENLYHLCEVCILHSGKKLNIKQYLIIQLLPPEYIGDPLHDNQEPIMAVSIVSAAGGGRVLSSSIKKLIQLYHSLLYLSLFKRDTVGRISGDYTYTHYHAFRHENK